MSKIENAGEFRCADLYLSAYLQVAGVELIRTDRVGTRCFFVFDATVADIEALKTAWVNNTGKVAAQPYSYAIKSLKSLVHLP